MKVWFRIVVFVIAFSSFSYGQEKSGPTFYVNAGLSAPSSPEEFSDYWNSGFNLGLAVGFPISNAVSFLPSFSYSRFGFNGSKFLEDYGYGGYGFNISGGSASMITLYGDFKASFAPEGNQVIPYIVGGAGFFRASTDDATISYQGLSESVQGDEENKFGIDIGAGLDVALSPKTSLFVSAKYVVGFTENESTQYFPVQVGLSFR